MVKKAYRCSTKSVKYLGIIIDEDLNWKHHISDIAIKLNKTNGVLSKLKHFIQWKILSCHSVFYHAMFEPHFFYSSPVRAQNSDSIQIQIQKSVCFPKENLTDYIFPKL